MAFASVGTLGSVQEKTSDADLVLTTSAQLDAGNLGVIIIASDNVNTTDADHGEIASVVDSVGNTWSKLLEYTNGQGVASDGATCSIWHTIAKTVLPSGGTITITFASAITAKAATAWEFTLGRSRVAVAGYTRRADDAANPDAVTISGLANQEYLWLHGLAQENPNSGSFIQDADYSSFSANGTTGGVGATNMMVRGGFRIFTGTTDTVDVSADSRDGAQVYVALREYIPLTFRFGPVIRALVGNRFGQVIAEIQPQWGPISWRLNDIGMAKFGMSTGDEKATSEILRLGNRLYLEFDNGLPSWGGIIDLPRDWDGGMIYVTAYSGEFLLSIRQSTKQRSFTGQQAGEVFRDLILEANALANIGIIPSDIWYGGSGYTLDFHYAYLINAIRDQLRAKKTNLDFAILPVLENGRISFTANLYNERGRTMPNVVLIEGHNTSGERLTENGPLVNWWDVVGAGSSWGDDRLSSLAFDQDSIDENDLRQSSRIFGDIPSQETLDAQGATLLEGTKAPKKVIPIAGYNLAPAMFGEYEIGDRIRVMLHSYGFGGTDTMVRITTREFDPSTGLCRLVTEEA